MIYKTPSTVPGHIRIVFELPSSVWAHRISVTGDFNDWEVQGEPLHQDRDGKWRTAIDLPLNCQFKFYYLVDGNKLIDRHADGLSEGSYREQKSIVFTRLPQHDSAVQHRRLASTDHLSTANVQSDGPAEPASMVPDPHVVLT